MYVDVTKSIYQMISMNFMIMMTNNRWLENK